MSNLVGESKEKSIPAVSAKNTAAGIAVQAISDKGIAIYARGIEKAAQFEGKVRVNNTIEIGESAKLPPALVLDPNNNAFIIRNKQGGDCIWIHADPDNGWSGISIRDQNGIDIVTLTADNNALVLRNKQGTDCIWIHAAHTNGGSGITLKNQNGLETIQIDGDAGDIKLLNADCAEDFEVNESEKIEPGSVMTLSDSGFLEQSYYPYDKRVVGVVSGAGNFKPGLVLGSQKGEKNRLPIALIGKIFCKVDADYEPIKVGDMLTTSMTRGHAMKSSDPKKSFGSVIGKAIAPLSKGRGLIPIIVTLQ